MPPKGESFGPKGPSSRESYYLIRQAKRRQEALKEAAKKAIEAEKNSKNPDDKK